MFIIIFDVGCCLFTFQRSPNSYSYSADGRYSFKRYDNGKCIMCDYFFGSIYLEILLDGYLNTMSLKKDQQQSVIAVSLNAAQ
jgi:hypothetical protein